MTDTDHGPGVTWLAERAGTTPDDLLHDGRALARALADATRAASDLAARLGSTDPDVRRRAEAEVRAVRARFEEPDATTPGERFGREVAAALRETAQRRRGNGPHGDAS